MQRREQTVYVAHIDAEGSLTLYAVLGLMASPARRVHSQVAISVTKAFANLTESDYGVHAHISACCVAFQRLLDQSVAQTGLFFVVNAVVTFTSSYLQTFATVLFMLMKLQSSLCVMGLHHPAQRFHLHQNMSQCSLVAWVCWPHGIHL